MVLANITANLASLVLSANYKPGRRLAISTAKDKPTRYDRKDWPQGIVSKTLDEMVKAGLIIRHRYVPRQKQTTIEPTPSFLEALSRHRVRLADIGRKTGAETIWVMARTGEDGWADNPNPKERTDYEESRDTPTSRKQMEEINAFLNAADVTYRGESQGPIFLRRSFLARHPSQPGQPRQSRGKSFMLNGRLFGGFWQNLPSTDRHALQIGGEELVDLDFTAMFIQLAYLRKVLELPVKDDAYRIPGLEDHRDGAKLGLISLLSRRGPMKQLSVELRELLPEGWTAKQFTQAAIAHHPGITDHFGKDIGVELMFAESSLLVHLLQRLNGLGIAALPMHDGVMVPASRKIETLAMMAEASSFMTGGIALSAREKPIVRP